MNDNLTCALCGYTSARAQAVMIELLKGTRVRHIPPVAIVMEWHAWAHQFDAWRALARAVNETARRCREGTA